MHIYILFLATRVLRHNRQNSCPRNTFKITAKEKKKLLTRVVNNENSFGLVGSLPSNSFKEKKKLRITFHIILKWKYVV